jgi:hypothetical protein
MPLQRGPGAHLTADDLVDLGHLLPASARELVRCLGIAAALALLNGLPGVLLLVPKTATGNRYNAQRWQQLVDLVGDAAMALLVAHYAGSALEINTCAALRTERRRRWLRAAFDTLTTGPAALSKNQAMHELAIALASAGSPMSARGIETAIDSLDATEFLLSQIDLFS